MPLRSLMRQLVPRRDPLPTLDELGSYACPAELRVRWTPTVDEPSPVDRALERLGEGPEAVVDLRGANLAGRDLSGLDLSGADLRGADLTRAKLKGTRLFQAQLSGCVFFEAELDDADLTGADLHGASLESASARRAGFGRTVLRGVRAIGCDFEQAVFSGSQCERADLRGCRMTHARLQQADLRGADCSRARMDHAKLTGSRVDEACFDGADLRHTVLNGLSGFERASWIGVDLRDVDFSGAYMLRRFVMDQNFIEEFRSRDPMHRLVHRIWALTSDCGRSMFRWSGWTLVWTLLFAGLYTLVNIDYGDHETWFSPLYFSFVTVTTLGYGDVLPASTPAQVLVVIQVTGGYLMLGGLISILSNKLARRAE